MQVLELLDRSMNRPLHLIQLWLSVFVGSMIVVGTIENVSRLDVDIAELQVVLG